MDTLAITVRAKEKAALAWMKTIAKQLLNYTEKELSAAVKAGKFIEITEEKHEEV